MTTEETKKPSFFLAIISFFIPIVGIALYFFWKKDQPSKAYIIQGYIIAGTIVNLLFFLIRKGF